MNFPFHSAVEKYEILHKLGEGGMGAVYKVRHRLLDELRVVKIVHANQAGSLRAQQRFAREAKAATALRHPNIAHIFDYVVEEGGAYLVMELIDGLTFKQLLASSGPIPLPLALELAAQSLDALGYLHQRGFLHRDVAPDNLMLCRRPDGSPGVKLIDFGLAKGAAETFDLTASNMFVGKVRYASPEVFKGPAVVPSARSDLYSFGVVFYEMLTGVCPIRGESFEELMAAHLLRPALGFESSDPEGRVPPVLRRLALDALAKEPEERPESAAAFREALLPYRGDADHGLQALWDDYWQDHALEVAQNASNDLSTTILSPATDDGKPRDASPTMLAAEAPPEGGIGGREDSPNTQPATPWQAAGAGRPLSRRGVRLAALVAVLAVIAGALWWSQSRHVDGVGESAISRPIGRLQLDAVPWGRVESITDGDGRAVPLESPLYTPTELVLPVGDYAVVLSHPDSPAPQTIRLAVPVARTVEHRATMTEVGIDDYLQRHGLAEELRNAGAVP